jgi:hypothetical protein
VSSAKTQSKGFIPQWVFLLVLVLLVGGIGVSRLSKQIKAAAHPVISEIQALNRTGLPDADGEQSEWIEVWNPTEETIDLEGYALSDDFRQLQKRRFPSRKLMPGEFLVIFASGKDRTNAFGELHTNFKLDPGGEYLALVAPDAKTRVHEILPKYPRQIGNSSYGIRPEFFQSPDLRLARRRDDMCPLEPTPGRANEGEIVGEVRSVKFSVQRGYRTDPVKVSLSVKTYGASIHFTLDGTRPSKTNGTLYAEPVEVSTTTMLRAVAHRPGFHSSAIGSQTYIFPRDVVDSLAPTLEEDARTRTIEGLSDLPTVSLLLSDTEDWSQGDTRQSLPASMEWMDPSDGSSEQVDCGLQIAMPGPGFFGERWKNSFQIIFDNRFGDSELRQPLFGRRKPRSFKRLMLIGGADDDDARSGLASLVADAWTRATLLDLNLHAARSRFVHLFLNGAYQGIYNLAELPESTFVDFDATSIEPKYDVRIGSRQIAGDSVAWNVLNAALRGTVSLANLDKHLDVDSLIDYSLVQLFSDPAELAQNGNWLAYRKRGVSKPFEFGSTFDFDALQGTGTDSPAVTNWEGPARILSALSGDAEFQAAFRRRAGELIATGEPLGRDRALDRFRSLANQLTNAMAADSLRWETHKDALVELESILTARIARFQERVQANELLDAIP